MTNHAFASSTVPLTYPMLKHGIEEILNRRFDSLLEVQGDEYLEIYIKNATKLTWSLLSVKLRSSRMIEMRQGHEAICSWVQSVVQNELAIKFRGLCSDEGLSEDERWEPKVKFLTFKEHYYHMNTWSHKHIKDKDVVERLKKEVDRVWGFVCEELDPALKGQNIIGE